MISFLEVCAFPPIRQKKANGWGTELMQIHTVRDLGPVHATHAVCPTLAAWRGTSLTERGAQTRGESSIKNRELLLLGAFRVGLFTRFPIPLTMFAV